MGVGSSGGLVLSHDTRMEPLGLSRPRCSCHYRLAEPPACRGLPHRDSRAAHLLRSERSGRSDGPVSRHRLWVAAMSGHHRHAKAHAAGGGGEQPHSRWERLSNFGLNVANGRAPSSSSSGGSGSANPGSSSGSNGGKPQPSSRTGRGGPPPRPRDDGAAAYPADGRGTASRKPPPRGQRRRGVREEDDGLPELPRLPRNLGRRAGLEDWDNLGDWGEPIPGETDWWHDGDPAGGGPRRKRRRHRAEVNGTPRDEFLRPMVDSTGIRYRLGLDEEDVAEDVLNEFEENQEESWTAVNFAGVLLGVPLVVGFSVSRIFAEPFYEYALRYNPEVFSMTPREKVEGAKEVHKHELRLRMDAAIGRAPPITDAEIQVELRAEAHHQVEHFREKNKAALLNLLSDGSAALALFGLLLRSGEGRGALFRTIGRIFGGFSDTAKAFLIIASTDILLGYHSEEGWTAAIHLLTKHYGIEVEEAPIFVFVAIVPVTMDAVFKLWIFRGLNRQNPAAAVTLRSMDRH